MNGFETGTKSWVIRIIIINAAIYLLQIMTEGNQLQYFLTGSEGTFSNQTAIMTFYLGLIPAVVVEKLYIWQFVSYMFLHGNFMHLFLNMYALLIFGIPIEQTWGSRKFLFYYFFTGIGAGLTVFLINTFILTNSYAIPTIGASGAVFGMLLAFGMLFPEAEILLFFFIPIKAKYLVVLYGALELYSLFSSGGAGGVSHVGHLGGLLFGIFYFIYIRWHGIEFKTKKFRAKFQKAVTSKETNFFSDNTDSRDALISILNKIKTTGYDSLNDAEIQKIKYLQIMNESKDGLCVEKDFDLGDAYCKKCETFESCFLREIKKYI